MTKDYLDCDFGDLLCDIEYGERDWDTIPAYSTPRLQEIVEREENSIPQELIYADLKREQHRYLVSGIGFIGISIVMLVILLVSYFTVEDFHNDIQGEPLLICCAFIGMCILAGIVALMSIKHQPTQEDMKAKAMYLVYRIKDTSIDEISILLEKWYTLHKLSSYTHEEDICVITRQGGKIILINSYDCDLKE